MPVDDAQQLAALRAILNDTTLQQALKARLDDPEIRSDELALILEKTIHKNLANPHNRLYQALEAPVSAAIASSVKRDPSLYINALFPIIGKVVRKYIAEALADFIQKTSSVLENSFSPRALKWRLQSMTTGVPFADLVLKNTYAYYIDEVMLIERHSGLLLAHVGRSANKDPDAISALLTALSDFAKDAFDAENLESEGLSAIKVGSNDFWLIKSADVIMALLIRGSAPAALRADLEQILSDILRSHRDLIRDFDGNRQPLLILEPELSRCFELVQNRHQAQARKKSKTKKTCQFLLWAALCLYCLWLACIHWQQNRCKHFAEHILHNVPSVVIADSHWQKRAWYSPRRDLHFKILLAPKDIKVIEQVQKYAANDTIRITFDSTFYQPVEQQP